MLAAIPLLLVLAFGAGPAFAFDMLDVRQLRDSGYRWCRQCDLSAVSLQGALLPLAQLQGADLSDAQLQGAVLVRAQLQGADLSNAQLQRANLAFAQLQDADLSSAQLQNADLGSAQLQDALLGKAQLQNAFLFGAQLQNAKMFAAQLQHADLSRAQLQNARLNRAQLQNAKMFAAQLQNADLTGGSVEGAILASAEITNALYGPTSPPPSTYVAGISGLRTVRVPYDDSGQQAEVSGLVSLRELLQRAGHRDLEREATYSIERARTRAAFAPWPGDPLRALEGALRFVAFELTTGYGLYPGRALLIMLGLMLLLSFAYLPWIGHRGRTRRPRGAIYRIWPGERLVEDGQGVQLVTYGDVSKRQRAERLQAKTILGRYGYSLWFSLLSAFHIGWRELSVGTWLSRLQPREYALRAQGWPRLISGMQSLISVYLVAIWALTYFGRPFQ